MQSKHRQQVHPTDSQQPNPLARNLSRALGPANHRLVPALVVLGNGARRLGEFDTAIRWFERASELFDQSELNPAGMATIYDGWARAQSQLGRRERACHLAQLALEAYREWPEDSAAARREFQRWWAEQTARGAGKARPLERGPF